jgi:hypothetical protein
MKKVLLTSLLALLVTAGATIKAQDRADEYLGLPGDNLNLYAVMNLFQESETLEAFERNLNDENSRINNLDLNRDNYVDYISVNDYENGNVHTIVMQVALNRNEKQDVGVFTVERFRDGSVQIQLIGDEALYGRNYIIEPYYAETPNPGYTGKARRAARTTYVEVSAWPVVRYIYQPHYVVWRSSWYWGYYPHWYNTWTPFYYHHYYGYHYHYYDHYYTHYRHWHTPRWSGYHNHYYSRVRIVSPTVVININKGTYKQTYSRPETRRDGEVLYARTQASRNPALSNGSSRRTSVTESTSRTREAAGTTRRAESTTVSRSSGARTTTPATTRNASERAATPNRSVSQTTSASRSASERPVNTERSVSARPSTSENRSVSTRSSGSTARPSTSENRGVATRSSGSTARPASSENRSVTARPSAPARNTEARSSAPSQSRESTARTSSSGQNRSTAARSSSAPRQQAASAPRSSSRQSEPAARSSNRSSTKSENSSSRKSEESRSRR